MKTLIGIALLVVCGCASVPKDQDLQGFSSGLVGCDAKEIKVSKWTPGHGFSNWDAACNGKIYKCTASIGGSSCKATQ